MKKQNELKETPDLTLYSILRQMPYMDVKKFPANRKEALKFMKSMNDNFRSNVKDCVDQYGRYLDFESLTPIESIIAKCADCLYVEGKLNEMECPDIKCPLHPVMCKKYPKK
jgi:hypothetical protein